MWLNFCVNFTLLLWHYVRRHTMSSFAQNHFYRLLHDEMVGPFREYCIIIDHNNIVYVIWKLVIGIKKTVRKWYTFYNYYLICSDLLCICFDIYVFRADLNCIVAHLPFCEMPLVFHHKHHHKQIVVMMHADDDNLWTTISIIIPRECTQQQKCNVHIGHRVLSLCFCWHFNFQ